jgi:hypothetical protein
MVVGVTLMSAGLVVSAAAVAVASGLLIHGIVAAAIGGVFVVSAVSGRPARTAG